MASKYWDDFDRRITETATCLLTGKTPPIRRIAIFITNKCNFKCDYCNVSQGSTELPFEIFDYIAKRYGGKAIIHITGGEPSIVKWLYKYIDSMPHIRFHLNSNLLLPPPVNIKRLKVSLDTYNANYFDGLVHFKGAFDRVVKNIIKASKKVVTSITYTLTKENYKQSPKFMRWCRKKFPDVYATFFSVYKGRALRFAFTNKDANKFFNNVKPLLEKEMDKESFLLLRETIDEKRRIIANCRFPENQMGKCYISMSERVVDCNGNMWNCSHLFRDGVRHNNNTKCDKCLYGCNRRLVMFNQQVETLLTK